MESFVYVAIEGINYDRDFYVVRELTILFPNGDVQHLHFKNPSNLVLTETQRKTARYTQSYLNGFGIADNPSCCLPNSTCIDVLKNIDKYRIYCAGDITTRFLMQRLPDSTIIDICKLFNFSYPKKACNPRCSIQHGGSYRNCSLFKAYCLKERLDGCLL